MREGATSGLGSPTVCSVHGPLMYPILRLAIPCALVGHQSADLGPAPRPQRHAPGHHPYDGERYRDGERLSMGFVESMVNQVISKRFCTRQQMQRTPRGAHLL
jgi:hypothetical protein